MYKVLEKYKGLLITFLFLDIFSLFPLLKTIDYSMTMPGGISKVDDLINIENEFEINGSFNTTYVIGLNKLTMYQYLVAIHNEQFIAEKNSSYYDDYTSEDHAISNRVSHQASIEYALINAFREAGKIDSRIKLDYKTDGLIVTSKPGSFKKLSMGDLIYKVNGYEGLELIDYINSLSEEIDLTVELRSYTNSENKTIKLTLNEFRYASYYRKHTINLNNSFPKITINSTSVGGPSGGLLNTLNVYNNLISEDITRGKLIAGTGTIGINGDVGAIGGMEQKIYTAQKNKVDYFFVPYSENTNSSEYGNYVECIKTYNKIKKPTFKIIPVKNFQEALAELEKIS